MNGVYSAIHAYTVGEKRLPSSHLRRQAGERKPRVGAHLQAVGCAPPLAHPRRHRSHRRLPAEDPAAAAAAAITVRARAGWVSVGPGKGYIGLASQHEVAAARKESSGPGETPLESVGFTDLPTPRVAVISQVSFCLFVFVCFLSRLGLRWKQTGFRTLGWSGVCGFSLARHEAKEDGSRPMVWAFAVRGHLAFGDLSHNCEHCFQKIWKVRNGSLAIESSTDGTLFLQPNFHYH